MRNSLTCLAIACVFLGSCCTAASAQDKPEENSDAERQARHKRAGDHMRRIEARDTKARQEVFPLIERPLLTFGDPARAAENGTLWAWGEKGRPAAFLELYQGMGSKAGWIHAVTLTSTERVAFKVPGPAVWNPEKAQIEPAAISGAPLPEAKETARLRQMKDLSRRFSGHEFWDPDNSRFELRLLVQPVHRYENASAGLHDGAAFVFAHGTNPEIVLLVEALGKSLAESRWHFSLARLGSAELHIELDGKEVWMRERTPGVVGRPTDPYWLFISPVDE